MMEGQIWNVVFAYIASAGGIGGIIILVVEFSVKTIASRLSRDYEDKLQKQMEKFKNELQKERDRLKTVLSKKEYVSKTRFDTEFEIYKELNQAFFKMIRSVNELIPYGLTRVPADKKLKKEYDDQCYSETFNSIFNAQNILYSNAVFIPKEFYDKYKEIIDIARYQLSVFEDRYDVSNILKPDNAYLKTEDYRRTDELNTKWFQSNEVIREYLRSLEII